MKIDIYKSTKNSKKYLSVPTGTDIANMTFSSDLDADLQILSPFKTEMEIDSSQPRLGMDVLDIIEQIKNNGFATHEAAITLKLI